jgi:hypothetical protein
MALILDAPVASDRIAERLGAEGDLAGVKGDFLGFVPEPGLRVLVPGQAHVPRYLAQVQYRFNRRYKLGDMIPRLAWMALRTPPMPYRLLKLAEACW